MPKGERKPPAHTANPYFRFISMIARGLLRLLFHIRVEGLERLPRTGGYVLVSNHLNWVDPIIMLAFLPAEPKLHFLAATEYTATGPRWIRILVDKVGGVIPVDRDSSHGNRAAVRQSFRVLRGGGVLGVFPEGKCGLAEGELLPLKRGAVGFAVDAGCPVLCAGISGSLELCLRKRIRFRIGDLVERRDGEGSEDMLERVQAALQAAIPPLDPRQPTRRLWTWLTDLPF